MRRMLKDLASRDVVARSIALKFERAWFWSKGDYVKLKLDHLGAELIN